MASFTAKMIRGSTTSIKDKVLPFPYHVCCGSAGIHSSGTEREHLLAVPGSLYVIAPRLPMPSVTQIVPFPLQGMYRSIPFHGEQRAAHCIRECWRYTANMILSQDTFNESVSAFNVSCPLFRLLAHTLIAPRGEYLLATPGSLYVLALACRGPTFLDTYLLPQQNVHKVRNSLTPQPCGAFLSMLLLRPRSTFFPLRGSALR